MKPVLRYPGAKWSISEWIVSHIPPHDVYLEPFFGSGAIFFNKKPSKLETINDLSGDVVNLFKVLRDNHEKLEKMIDLTPWARDEYYSCTMPNGNTPKSGNDIEDARRFLVRCWQGMSSKIDGRTGWRSDIKCDCGQNHVKTWIKVPERIRDVVDRLKQVQIENQPAVEIIKRYGNENVFIYADPPYLLSTRSGTMYYHEMTDADHLKLLDVLDKHPGPVIVSGYDNELYKDRLADWHKEARSSVADKGKRKEVVWLNKKASMYSNRLFEETP